MEDKKAKDMKRYIVFLKQVPLSTKVEMDPVTRTLKRSSAMTRTNPDDLYALQLAVKLKRQTGAEIVAVSMGPASAEEVLREALQRGADKAVLLSSKACAGSDTWCTSLVLAAAVRKLGEYDLLLFGKMAVDGDTAQVGPEVAGQLDIPRVTHLTEVSDISDTCMCVRKKAGRLFQRMEVDLPCVVTVGRETGEQDCPTLTGWRWAQWQTILHWDECDLGLKPSQVGLQASPTQVVSTMVPRRKKDVEWLPDGEKFFAVVRESMRRGINF